jgi:hypothetical protein
VPPTATARHTNNNTSGASKVPPEAALRSRSHPAARRSTRQLERVVRPPVVPAHLASLSSEPTVYEALLSPGRSPVELSFRRY